MSFEQIADALRGRTPTRMERVVYAFGDDLEENGDLQLWFGADLIRLHEAADYQSIALASTPWVDPFAGREAENEEYLRTHGQFRLVDVTNAPGYREMIGARIHRVLPLTNKFGNTIGVRLELETCAANVYVGADELLVTWGDDVPLW